jgi:hypothetical protein
MKANPTKSLKENLTDAAQAAIDGEFARVMTHYGVSHPADLPKGKMDVKISIDKEAGQVRILALWILN